MSNLTAQRGAITDAAYELPYTLVEGLEELAALNGWSLSHTLMLAVSAYLDGVQMLPEGVRW